MPPPQGGEGKAAKVTPKAAMYDDEEDIEYRSERHSTAVIFFLEIRREKIIYIVCLIVFVY
jgi:hypothetical protein